MNSKLINDLKDPEKLEEALSRANQPKAIVSGAAMNTRIYTPKKIEDRLTQYEKEKQLREMALNNAIPFIHDEFNSVYKLTQGLILIVACSGHSKSTTVGNLLAHFLRTQNNANAVVISNEESSEAVYNRTACVLLGHSFRLLHKNRLPQKQVDEVRGMVGSMVKRVEIVDDPAWDMTYLEDVQAVLEYAAQKNIRMVVIDYLQTIAFSREKPYLEPFQVSKILGLYLKDYGKRLGIPILVFAQLRPGSESPDIMSRIQNDKTIYNHAFDCIELVPDFKSRTTKFVFHKNRFGDAQGKEITMKFVDGSYLPIEDI